MAWYHYEQLSETPVHCVVAIKQKSNLSVREGLDNKHNWRLSCTIIQIYNEPSAGTISVILVDPTQKDFLKKIGDPEPDGKNGWRYRNAYV